MPLPKGSEKANLQLLSKLLGHHTDQQKLLETWKDGGNKHQLAICFEFPKGFKIDFSQGSSQSTPYAERVLRLCESVNQPDTIKADVWTRTPNNGTLAGVQPGVEVLGTPVAPELFLSEVGYVLVAMVYPGTKIKMKAPEDLVSADPAYEIIENPDGTKTAKSKIPGLADLPVWEATVIEKKAAITKAANAKKAVKKATPKVKPYDPDDDPGAWADDDMFD